MNYNNKIAQREKEYRTLIKELNTLYTARRKLGEYKLPKPIKNGWYKHLALRDDVARRKDADVFQNVLDVAGLWIWGRDKKHADKVWRKPGISQENICWPGIKKLYIGEYNQLTPKAQHYFEGIQSRGGYWGRVIRFHCRVPRHYFKMAYTRCFITHRKIIDNEINARISEIEAILLRPEYYHLKENYSSVPKWLKTYTNKSSRKAINQQLLKVSLYDSEACINDGIYNTKKEGTWYW